MDPAFRMLISDSGQNENRRRAEEKGTAVVCVFSPKRGVVEESVDAFCCPQCKRYYILEKSFDRLQRKSKLCCRIITRTGAVSEFVPSGSDELSDQSFYNSLGYNVNQEENLSPDERRAVLDFVISNGFKTQKQAIGDLECLIRRNGRRANMGNAVRRWQSDIDYLISNKGKNVKPVKIDRIFLTKHKWR